MPCTVTVVNRVLLYTYAPRSAADAHAVVAEISAAFLGRDGVSMVSASMPNGRPHVFVVVDGPMDTVSSRLPSAVNGIPVIAVQRAAVAPQTPAGEVKSKELLASVSSATKGGYKPCLSGYHPTSARAKSANRVPYPRVCFRECVMTHPRDGATRGDGVLVGQRGGRAADFCNAASRWHDVSCPNSPVGE